MKRRFEWAWGAALVLVSLAAAAGAQPIYSWVGPHGTVHYADVPRVPGARRVNPALGASSFPVPRQTKAKPTPSSPPRRTPPPAKKVPGLTPAQAQALCRATRARYESLRPVRRLHLYEPNGKARYLSGQNLVLYKQRAKLLMERFCASTAGGSRG